MENKIQQRTMLEALRIELLSKLEELKVEYRLLSSMETQYEGMAKADILKLEREKELAMLAFENEEKGILQQLTKVDMELTMLNVGGIE